MGTKEKRKVRGKGKEGGERPDYNLLEKTKPGMRKPGED